MAVCIQEKEKSNILKQLPVEIPFQKEDLRDTKHMGNLPARVVKPNFGTQNIIPKAESSWSDDIEYKIAVAFERKDIIELVNMLCISNNSPLYIRKSTGSPLYTFIGGVGIRFNEDVREMIGLTETAVFLLLNDKSCKTEDITVAFKVLCQRSPIYKPSLSLIDEFHNRLGLHENVRKADEIIQKLKKAKQDLGFNR